MQNINVSDVKQTLAQVEGNYRRALEFNNNLLIQNYQQRYYFRTTEKVRQAREAGVTSDKINRYILNRESRFPKKMADYTQRLRSRTEQQAADYVRGLKIAFGVSVD